MPTLRSRIDLSIVKNDEIKRVTRGGYFRRPRTIWLTRCGEMPNSRARSEMVSPAEWRSRIC